MENKQLYIFDICGTLYHSNTTMDFCEYRCKSKITKFILKYSKSFIGKIVNKILFRFIGFELIRYLHLKSLEGILDYKLNEDAKDFVESFLEKKKIEEVHEILKNSDKDKVVLVSATIEPVAKAIACRLGNLTYLSSALKYDNNKKCLGKIENDLLGNKHKYFKNKKIDFIITDNESDIVLCEMADKVIIVSKKKNFDFWNNQNINISKIIGV